MSSPISSLLDEGHPILWCDDGFFMCPCCFAPYAIYSSKGQENQFCGACGCCLDWEHPVSEDGKALDRRILRVLRGDV